MIIKNCLRCGKEYKTFACQANRRKYCSKSCARKITNTLRKGKPISEKQKLQLEKLHILTRNNPPMKGVHRFGELSPSWKGGITNLYRAIRQMEKYSIWRKNVLERESYKCQMCGSLGLDVHHIKPFKIIILEHSIKTIKSAYECEELWYVSNGMCLCKECHKKTDSYGAKLNNI